MATKAQVNKTNNRMDTRTLSTMAMLCAIGIIMASFFEIPIIPAAPFLKYDPADIPVLIGTLVYGPLAGILMTVVVSLIQTLTHGAGGWIGFVMHVIATGAMALAVGLIYKKGPETLPRAVLALVCGVLAMTGAMTGMNLVLTPIFMGAPVSVVKSMLLPAIIPFNLIKAGVNSAMALVLFRVVEKMAVRQIKS